MKRIVVFYFALAYFGADVCAQGTVTGSFTALSNQQVKLIGFEGFNTYTIDSTMTDEQGRFQLSFSEKDYGMAYLAAEDDRPFIVILDSGEDLILEGEALSFPQTVVITSGNQNQLFGQYATEHPRREQALSAWVFLERIYQQDSLFATHETPSMAIENEMQRINEENEAFLASLNPDTYISWFLPVRKLVS